MSVLAAVLGVWLVSGSIHDARNPDPNRWFDPMEVAVAGGGVITVLLVIAWVFRRFGPSSFVTIATATIVVGPIGLALASVDAATVDMINSAPHPIGSVLALALLIGAPVVTVAGVVGVVAEMVFRRR